MLRTWKHSREDRRGGLPRKKARVYRPRSEELESRSLLTLFPGNPFTEPNTEFKGVGTSNAAGALNSFEAAIGGVDNGGTASPQASGFRSINWDGITNFVGGDFGGGANSIVVTQGKTIVIPKNRFITRGVFFGDPYAVSNDGFVDVNPSVAGLFPAFSMPNTFAMTNDNTIDLSFNLATGNNGTPVPAATRGFGAIFINNEALGAAMTPSSSIEYFSGDKSLGKFFVPTGTQGQPEFLGELFPDALVTRVTLTLGTDTLFSFNGTPPATPGPVANNPATGHNLVVTDDFAYPEPMPLSSVPPILSGAQGVLNAQPVVNATVGTALPSSTVVATFSDDTPGSVLPAAFTAVINWGDGHITNGAIVPSGRGGFSVMGTNTYATAGRFPISVDVEKLDAAGTSISLTNTAVVAAANTTTTLTASPTSAFSGQPVTLTATIAPVPGTAPGGMVTFLDGTTVLGTGSLDNTGTATFTTNSLTPGSHNLTAAFGGNSSFNASTSSGVTVTVSPVVTSQIQPTLGAVRRKGGQFQQVVTLTNNGSAKATFTGPIDLVLANLSPKVKLVNKTGTTTTQAPAGSQFITVTSGTLGPNQSVTMVLVFKARSRRLVNYTPTVLAGISQP